VITSEEIIRRVENYLLRLGYSKEMMARNVRIGHTQVDLVVYEHDDPRIVVEIKNEKSFPKRDKIETLRFHPYVRVTQSLAKSLGTPYYLLSDGESFLWFTTNEAGRPELLLNPIHPMVSVDTDLKTLSKNILVRIFNELREHLYKNLGSKYLDEVSILIFAKLKSEYDDERLKLSLIEGRTKFKGLHEIIPSDLLENQASRDTNLFREAFRILDRISFRNASPLDLLSAIDDVFLNQTSSFKSEIKVPRWVISFLVHLAVVNPEDIVLDIHSNYGDVIPGVLILEKTAKIWTLASSPRSMVWATIQQLIMSYNERGPITGNTPPYDVYKTQVFSNPHKIIAIPPFGMRTNNAGQGLTSFYKPTISSEEAYLDLSIQWVRSGGRVVAIIPDNILFSKRSERFRFLVHKNAQITGIISLGNFMPQTSLRASILVLDKLPTHPLSRTFMAELEQINKRDVFNCLEIPQIASVLESFQELNRIFEQRSSSVSWWVTSDNLNINNLTPSHYIPPEITGRDYLSSPFPTVQLIEIAEVNRGSSFKLDEEGEISVIGPAAIRPLLLDKASLDRTSKKNLKTSYHLVQRDDVVLNIISTYRGAAATVTSDLGNAVVNRHVIVIRPKSSSVIPEYLAIALNSKYVKQQFEKAPSGVVIPSLNLKTVREVLIPLPDIEAQMEIVEKVRLLQSEWANARKQYIDSELKMHETIQNLGL